MKFIGNQPITFNEENYNRNLTYFLTLKLDGRRYLIKINDKGETFLINTKSQSLKLSYTLPNFKNSIFDTELFKNTFYIFDVLELNGKDTRDLPFSQRLSLLSNLRFSRNSGIVLKKFYTNSNIYTLFQKLSKKITKDHDGIIFTPDTSYYTSSLKWKPIRLLSIDFKIKKLSGNRFGLLTQSGKIYNTPLKKGIGITKVSKKDYEKFSDVVEFIYKRNHFIPIRNRPDKTNSNALYVINDNLKTILNPPNMKKILTQHHII